MRWLCALLAGAALLLAAPASALHHGQPGGPNPPQPLTVFATGSFPESLAFRGGNLYASLGFAGEVAKVTAAGVQSLYADGLPIGNGLLTGLAFDTAGNLYVAAATFADDPAPGVFVIPPGGGFFSRVATLPAGSFPNGLAFRNGWLYVSDSALGAIWRIQATGGNITPTSPWYQNALLAPRKGIGANGIAFDADGTHLYVAVADSGRLLGLTLTNGNVSGANVLAEQEQLRSVDGISLDSQGNLYLAVNDTNRLYRFNPSSGGLARLADRSDGLAYPTQPAFDTGSGSTTLYLSNGALYNGIPDIEAFDVGVAGQPLP